MGPDDLRQLIHPLALRLFGDVFLDACEDDVVGPFDFSVGLWVVY